MPRGPHAAWEGRADGFPLTDPEVWDRRLASAVLAAYRSAILVSASRTFAVGAAAAMPRNSSTNSRSSNCVTRIMAERLRGILHLDMN
jgi:hypothetical protein